MAEKEVVYKISADTKNAQKSLGDLENEIKSLNEELKNVEEGSKEFEDLSKQLDKTNTSMDKLLSTPEGRFEKLNKDFKEAPVNVRAMNKQIQEYQAIALEAGRTSPVGKAALQEAANLKDRYNDINAEVNRLADDGLKMQAGLDLGTGIVAGYSAFQGALALTGVESEQLQETLVKLQAAQSVLMGLEQLRTLTEKESTVTLVAKNAVEKIKAAFTYQSAAATTAATTAETAKTGATVASTSATTASTIATRIFSAALLGVPIFAIVAGLTALVAGVVFFSDEIKKVPTYIQSLSESFRDLGAGAQTVIGILSFGIVPAIAYITEALEENGVVETESARISREASEEKAAAAKKAAEEYIAAIKAEEKALKESTEAKVLEIDFEIAKMNAAGKDVSDLERSKIELQIESTKKEIELANLRNESRIQELSIIAKLNNFAGEAAKTRLKEIEDEGLALQKNLTGFEQSLVIFDIKQTQVKKQKAKAAVEDAEKNGADVAKVEKDLLQDQLDREEAQFQLLRDLQQTAQENEIDDLIASYEKKFELANGNAELETALAQKQAEDIAAINEKYREDEVVADEEVIEDKKLSLEDQLNNQKELVSSLTNLNDAWLEAQLAGAEGNEQRQQEIRKKAFARDKALKIAEATITGIQAVQSALASPFPFNIALAAINGATALANITKIARTKFDGAGGGGAAPTSLGNTGRAAGGANVGQVTNTTTTIGEPTKVFVTEQDISNTQNKVQVNEDIATL